MKKEEKLSLFVILPIGIAGIAALIIFLMKGDDDAPFVDNPSNGVPTPDVIHDSQEPPAPEAPAPAEPPMPVPKKTEEPSGSRVSENNRFVFGVGVPHRTAASADDKYAALWKQKLPTIIPDEMEALLNTEGFDYFTIVNYGLEPWIVRLGRDVENYCIPGSIIEINLQGEWKNPSYGEYTLAEPGLNPSWEILLGPNPPTSQWTIQGGLGNGLVRVQNPGSWVNDNTFAEYNGGFNALVMHTGALARIPYDIAKGEIVLDSESKTQGPTPTLKNEETGLASSEGHYRIVIESAPYPDRETLFSCWSYVLIASQFEKEVGHRKNRRQRFVAAIARNLLADCSKQLDGEMHVLAKELLDHGAFKKAVSILEESEKSEKPEPEKVSESK